MKYHDVGHCHFWISKTFHFNDVWPSIHPSFWNLSFYFLSSLFRFCSWNRKWVGAKCETRKNFADTLETFFEQGQRFRFPPNPMFRFSTQLQVGLAHPFTPDSYNFERRKTDLETFPRCVRIGDEGLWNDCIFEPWETLCVWVWRLFRGVSHCRAWSEEVAPPYLFACRDSIQVDRLAGRLSGLHPCIHTIG